MSDKNLLIVDDEMGILKTYSEFFSKRGFVVETACNGLEGLEKLRTSIFPVSIIDISMPKMDGIALAKMVQDEDIDTSIIILTGHGEKNDAVSAINNGVAGWFEKNDIKMDVLLSKVNDLFNIISHNSIANILSKISEDT